MTPDLLLLASGVFAVAILYSAVGHAGASGYIAIMALAGLAPDTIRPVALTLNILVASIASWQFYRAGHFSWRRFWPFALPALPMAFLGGYLELPVAALKPLLGGILLYSAAQMLWRPPAEQDTAAPPLPAALAIGAAIGLLSGLTGTGGGIFLTPLLLLLRWARAREAAAVSALFILANSSAGLAGFLAGDTPYPAIAPLLPLAAAAGGLAGAWLGSRRLPPLAIKRVLAVVLVIAGTKLLLA